MFNIRLEARYGQTMRDCDIQDAREILNHIRKLEMTSLHVRTRNWDNLKSATPNLTRVAKNIIRIYNLLEAAYDEVENLHDCYIAQFTEFDDDGEIIDTLPDFDFSEQSRLDDRAVAKWLDARFWFIHALCDFASALHIYENFEASYDALKTDEAISNFIRNHVCTAITPAVKVA